MEPAPAPSAGKSANTSFSIRYNANNEELEDVFQVCEEDPPTPQQDFYPSGNASPKKLDKSASIIDKYFKNIRVDKDKEECKQNETPKKDEDAKNLSQKEANSSPMKEYLNRLGKRGNHSELGDAGKEPNETWKIFHDFKFKIAQAVEEIKSSRTGDEKEKSVPRDSSISDSEENSVIRDSDQQSVGDTDNQVSSLDSSLQNLSGLTQPVTAKVNFVEPFLDKKRNVSESSDDTQKNFALDDNIPALKEDFEEDSLDVESGVEALEETNIDGAMEDRQSTEVFPDPPTNNPDYLMSPLLPKTSKQSATPTLQKNYFFTFSMTFLTLALLLSYILMPNCHKWNGFVLGLWSLSFGRALKGYLVDWLCDNSDSDSYKYFKMKREEAPMPMAYMIPSVKEHRPLKKFEGWINHYRVHNYDPYIYNINKTTTAFMKLEGCNLRISYTRTKVAKKAVWDEQIENVTFYQHRLYNLLGARVILLPKGLVSKRYWSKKYPICVVLSENEKVQVLEKESDKRDKDSTDKKTDPETADVGSNSDSVRPKKKFVWRRKDKTQTDGVESTKGLRHRIRKKIHKDKKTEDASTSTDPLQATPEKTAASEEELIDVVLESNAKTIEENAENEEVDTEQYREYMRIKDFLDEAEELETGENTGDAEWSLQTKESRDMHAHLYIFARTSRDKYEWYRRIRTAIQEANKTEDSTDESGSDPPKETENVFKVADKDAIAFARQSCSAYDVAPEPMAVSWAAETLESIDLEAHEKEFWPYMYKIIQAHAQIKSNATVGVMCSLDCPTKEQQKGKGKKAAGHQGNMETERNPLPLEVAWLNSLLGRIAYDAMRNPAVVTRVQRRIQRKLNTLKLPSFMGPLIATELSLGSVTPLVALVGGATWDERGVWLDADVRYDGGAFITLNTQINLSKLKHEKSMPLEEQLVKELKKEDNESIPDLEFDSSINLETLASLRKKSAIFDSDVDDSAESSSDEDSGPVMDVGDDNLSQPQDGSSNDSGSGAKKFLRIVDKITTSRYFQHISDYKYVKRAMDHLSNTDIRLHLELKGLEGRLAVNLPPPPHDRVWLGFRSNPRIWLKAKPALGARAVRFTHVTNWIEQKLCKEFEKVLVLPNMEDITVELMTPTPVHFD